MKLLVLALSLALALPFISAAETVTLGSLEATLSSEPEKLEPGQSSFTLQLAINGEPLVREPVSLTLFDNSKTLLRTNTITDEYGTVEFDYFFSGPGLYDLDVAVRGEHARIPVQVHGQYMLLLGFLASSFIVLALLLGRI